MLLRERQRSGQIVDLSRFIAEVINKFSFETVACPVHFRHVATHTSSYGTAPPRVRSASR